MDNVKHLRISRLLNGARRDLESTEAAQAAGWMGTNSEPIDVQVARLRATVAMWEGKLTALEAGA